MTSEEAWWELAKLVNKVVGISSVVALAVLIVVLVMTRRQ
jgi:hypothetical protein